jgi:transcriptional regulator with XRE-family HTH domain
MDRKSHIALHREKAGLTQADVARIVSHMTGSQVTQSQVSRWEDDPDSIPARYLPAIATALGVSIDDLFRAPLDERGMAIDPGTPYALLRRNVDVLSACLASIDPIADAGANVPADAPSPSDVDGLCTQLRRKPNVAIAGHFDAGKTRLANAILGGADLLSRYTPTTAISTWLVHAEDRPAGCHDDVYILRGVTEPTTLNTAEKLAAATVKSGGLEILHAYTTHQGKRDLGQDHAALVFMDRPLLKACNLVDLPGEHKDERDTKVATLGLSHMDVLLYLSPSAGFMDQRDLGFLRQYVRRLPLLPGAAPLANLIIVASHAHPNIADAELGEILSGGAETLIRELSTTVFAERAEGGPAITLENVRQRIFPFWFEREERRAELRQAVHSALAVTLPAARAIQADAMVDAFRDAKRGACDQHVASYRQAVTNIDAARRDHAERVRNEPTRRALMEARRAAVAEACKANRAASLLFVRNTYEELVNTDAVEQFIRNRYRDDKKSAQKHGAGALADVLQSRVAQYTTEQSQRIAPLVDAFIAEYDGRTAATLTGHAAAGAVAIPFDARAVFVGGLAGAAAVGAMGAWAASLGNLGGYIIAAKAASLLSALGIGVGGAAAVTSFVAALGGPLVVAVGLAIAVAWVVSSLFGDSWERRLAKKVVEAFAKQDVLSNFSKGAERFWEDSLSAFDGAADALERTYRDKLTEHGALLEQRVGSADALGRTLAALEAIRQFFVSLPWPPLGTARPSIRPL